MFLLRLSALVGVVIVTAAMSTWVDYEMKHMRPRPIPMVYPEVEGRRSWAMPIPEEDMSQVLPEEEELDSWDLVRYKKPAPRQHSDLDALSRLNTTDIDILQDILNNGK